MSVMVDFGVELCVLGNTREEHLEVYEQMP
jgi:hypothetical protein